MRDQAFCHVLPRGDVLVSGSSRELDESVALRQDPGDLRCEADFRFWLNEWLDLRYKFCHVIACQ